MKDGEIEEFDTPENSKNRLDYEQFVELLNQKLSDNFNDRLVSEVKKDLINKGIIE